MAREKLIPANLSEIKKREPTDRFREFASRVLAVPKSEVDRREAEWKSAKKRARKRPKVV